MDGIIGEQSNSPGGNGKLTRMRRFREGRDCGYCERWQEQRRRPCVLYGLPRAPRRVQGALPECQPGETSAEDRLEGHSDDQHFVSPCVSRPVRRRFISLGFRSC